MRYTFTGFFIMVFLVAAFLCAGLLMNHYSFVPAEASSKPSIETTGHVLASYDLSDPAVIKKWDERVFKGHTRFEISFDEKAERVLKVSSKGTSSTLYTPITIPIASHPILMWEWKAVKFPSGKKNEKLGAKSDNDYVGRVYVIFKSDLPFKQDIIQYVWDDFFPPGESAESPFMKGVKILVVRQGPGDQPGGWAVEKRDLYADYEKMFGKAPKKDPVVLAIGADSDNTNTEAEMLFKKITFSTASEEAAAVAAVASSVPHRENLFHRAGNFIGGQFSMIKNAIVSSGKKLTHL